MEEGGKPKLIRLSIEEAIERFYTVKILDNLKPRTFKAYEQGLNAFKKAVARIISFNYTFNRKRKTQPNFQPTNAKRWG
tara:strand:+ start:361 stop:597 length:237 start_codon:yes stop_codon:yes gene_type:complete